MFGARKWSSYPQNTSKTLQKHENRWFFRSTGACGAPKLDPDRHTPCSIPQKLSGTRRSPQTGITEQNQGQYKVNTRSIHVLTCRDHDLAQL